MSSSAFVPTSDCAKGFVPTAISTRRIWSTSSSSMSCVGPWGVFGGEFQGDYRGTEITLEARAAYAASGNGYVELVQPMKGDWTASVFLEERGEGAYHLGYWVDDLEATVARAKDLGYG